jgi:hypothetical protein
MNGREVLMKLYRKGDKRNLENHRGFKLQKQNIYSEQQGTFLVTTKEMRNVRRTPCYVFRENTLYLQTQLVSSHSSNGRLQTP